MSRPTLESCGCRSGIDKNGREWIEQCAACEAEFKVRHQAAVESCSHVYRNKFSTEAT